MPTNSAGAWRIELLLRDPLTGGIRASSGQTLLVADRPSIFLTVGHPIVRPGARVQAGLLVNPGTVPDDVRVLAGLTRPDGTDVLLDTSAVERSEAGLIDLPERPLGDDLPGSYRVWARLVDRRSGAVVGLADAGFAVCASSSPIRGVVVDPSGNAVSPSAASIGHVVALDVDAGGLAGSASLDDAGAYRLDVAPGRYLLLGQILDRSGWREASALDVVTAGCGDVAAPVDLVADPPAPVPGLQASPPMPPLTASRVDQCSLADADPAKPLLAVHDQVGGGASSRGVAGRVLTEIFAGDLVGAAPGVAVTTADTRGALAALAVLPPAFPGDAASQVVLPGRAADFLLVLGYRAAGPAPVLAASLEDVANGEVIWRDEAAAPLGADGVGTATIADLANRLARPGGQSLPCFRRAFRPPSVAFSPSTRGLRLATIASPGAVDVALSLEGAAPASFAGQPFKVTARVRVDGAAVAAVPVEFSLRGPGTLGQSTAQTDDAGDAVVQYTAPPTGSGTSLLSAVVLMGGRHVAQTLAIPYRPAASCGGADVRFCITDLGSLPATGPLPRPAVSSGRVLGGAGIGGDMAVRPVDHVEYLQTVVDQRGGVRLTQAYTTGDDGQVLAFGMVDGQPHALLLTPR